MNNPDFEINLNSSNIENARSNIELETTPVEFNIELNGGARGLKGDKGDTGAQGPQGPQGEQGIQGEKGDTGERGPQGIQGETGPQGIQGETGPQGIPGIDGQDGRDGEDGFSPVATVSKSGKTATITITDSVGTTTATVEDGADGRDGYMQYTAGTGIDITGGVISNTQTSAEWGNITGTLSNQTDLQTALNSKANQSTTYTKTEVDNLIPDVSNFITKTVDDLTNYYLKSETYTQAEVNSLIGAISTIDIQIVQTLPTHDISTSTIYLVPKNPAEPSNYYDEYIYVSNAWEKIGDTEIDLSGYQTKITSTNKLDADLVDDSTSTNKFFDGLTILSYGSSTWNDFINAYNNKEIVYCRASSNSNPGSGSQTRLAFMAYVNNATTPTSVEFQYYRSVSSHSATQQGDQVFVYSLTSTNGGTWSVTTREAMANIDVSGGLTRSYSSNKLTIDGSGKQKLITQQDAAPSSPAEGDLWLDTDDNTNLVEIDSTVSTTSTNPIENQAITNYVDGKVPTTIYTGTLRGTETATLSGVKNKLIIYAMCNGANVVYMMDIYYTSANNHASGMQWAYDTASGLEFYASEGNYNASTGIFTHSRIGYVNIGTGTYTARNSTNTYFIYRIDTI